MDMQLEKTFMFVVAMLLVFVSGVMMCRDLRPNRSVFADQEDNEAFLLGGDREELPVETGDWPMWRYSPRRGAVTPHGIPGELHLHWVRELPEPRRAWPPQQDEWDKLEFDLSYEPVVAGDMIYIPSMVTDSLTAYDIDSGRRRWRFYTDGPVRVSPVEWNGRVYLPSDDGHIYCLDAEGGNLRWKFRGVNSNRQVLGNERLISMWPVRGGPVIKDGVVYFSVGIWPHEGVFYYALDAVTGEVEWRNSGLSKQPHGTAKGRAFGGPAPQGSIAVSGYKLIVPGGRTTPAVFDRSTGRLLHYFSDWRYDIYKGAGGYRVFATDDYYFNQRRYRNVMYNLDDGLPYEPSPDISRLDPDIAAPREIFGVDGERPFAQELPDGTRHRGEKIAGLERLHLRAGDRLYGSGRDGMICALDIEVGEETLIIELVWRDKVDGAVYRMLAARDRLFVVTECGRVYCFGKGERDVAVHRHRPGRPEGGDDKWVECTRKLLEKTGVDAGYALMFGIGSGRLLDEMLLQSDLHIVAYDPDEDIVGRLRERYSRMGLYGDRVAVRRGDAMTMRLPDYIASLIISEDPVAGGLGAGGEFAASLFRSLRPYGGTVYLPLSGEEQLFFAGAVEDAGLGKHRLEKNGAHVLLIRPGALPGSETWSHQYGDSANTTYSADSRVKAPLGITWFGGPGNEKVLPRHRAGPVPQVVEGRLVILGSNHISARCVYTGREIWALELPLVGKRFTCLEREGRSPVYLGLAPGANFIGSPYITTSDSVYIIHEDRLMRLDLDTGERLDKFNLPGREDLPRDVASEAMERIDRSYGARISIEKRERWGHILIWEDYLVVGAYPHFYDDGRPGQSNYNATSSEFLVVMARYSGEIKWAHQARYGFRHNAIAVDGGRLFVIDHLSAEVQSMLERRGVEPELSPEIRAFEIESGELLWSYDENVFGTWLGYSLEHDLLLQTGRRGVTGGQSIGGEPHRQLALRGEDGRKLWKRNERVAGPVALHEDMGRVMLGTRLNPGMLDILTGETVMVPNPLSGIPEQWESPRSRCGTQNVSRYLTTFRSGDAAYFDLKDMGGTGNLSGFRAGCTNNLVVADGMLNAPDYTRTCNCSHQHQTSLALVHMPEVEQWTFNTYTDPEPGTIKRVGLNMGAPGARFY